MFNRKINPLKTAMAIAILGLIMCFPGLVHSESGPRPRRMIMVGQVGPEENANGRFLKLLYTEAFKRLGIELVYKHYPAIRASYMSDGGEVDGQMARVADFNLRHPGLVKVKEPLWTVKISAFVRDPFIKVQGWDSLVGSGFRVDYRRGSEIVEAELAKRVPAEKLSTVTHESSGIKKLLAGNTDLFIHDELSVRQLLAKPSFREELKELFGLTSVYNAGVLEEVTLHGFLHERYSTLAKDLSQVLKTMKAEGLWEIYIREARKGNVNIKDRAK